MDFFFIYHQVYLYVFFNFIMSCQLKSVLWLKKLFFFFQMGTSHIFTQKLTVQEFLVFCRES